MGFGDWGMGNGAWGVTGVTGVGGQAGQVSLFGKSVSSACAAVSVLLHLRFSVGRLPLTDQIKMSPAARTSPARLQDAGWAGRGGLSACHLMTNLPGNRNQDPGLTSRALTAVAFHNSRFGFRLS